DNDSTVWQSPHLPPEILRLIFLRTIAPRFLFGSYLSAGRDSAWYKSVETALAISSVCKAWYHVGIAFLYEDVVFRRLDQLPKFLRTIKTRSIFQHLVKKITVHTFVHYRYGASFQKYLQEILNQCSSLKDLSLRCLPLFHQYFLSTSRCVRRTIKLPIKYVSMFLPSAGLPTSISAITRLSLRTSFSRALLDMTCNSLVSLSLFINDPDAMQAQLPILIPNLEDLILSSDEIRNVEDILSLLSVPSLQRFSFSGYVDLWPLSLAEDPLLTFFKTHGRHLRVLCNLSNLRSNDYAQAILDACPVLEHIVLRPYQNIQDSHPTVRWVDILPDIGHDPVEPHEWSFPATAWPKLERVRVIPKIVSLYEPEQIFNIIASLSPDLVTSDSEAFTLDFPGIRVECTPSIVSVERFLDDERNFEDTGSDDNDYQPDDADHQYDSDSDCSDDISCSSDFSASSNDTVASLSDFLCRPDSSESNDRG
ncbi:hypothetical protein C0993_001733, partial [Termitomyces sp. T159_Od127]